MILSQIPLPTIPAIITNRLELRRASPQTENIDLILGLSPTLAERGPGLRQTGYAFAAARRLMYP
jgi:hypothetical protein